MLEIGTAVPLPYTGFTPDFQQGWRSPAAAGFFRRLCLRLLRPALRLAHKRLDRLQTAVVHARVHPLDGGVEGEQLHGEFIGLVDAMRRQGWVGGETGGRLE